MESDAERGIEEVGCRCEAVVLEVEEAAAGLETLRGMEDVFGVSMFNENRRLLMEASVMLMYLGLVLGSGNVFEGFDLNDDSLETLIGRDDGGSGEERGILLEI